MTVMEINGHTKLCGLIGNPVEHTLSPMIHNTLAEKMGHNLVYVPFRVEQGRLQSAVEGAYGLNIMGMNVTVPYKSDVILHLKDMDSLAGKIGAVNTLVRVQDGYKGYNTDILGLYRAMCSEGISLKGEQVVLLGAGGAARAVAFLCAEKEASRVYLLNRSLEKAEAVANEVNAAFGADIVCPMLISDYQRLPERKMLAIQGTSVGLHPHGEQAVIEDKAFYRKIHTGYDLIYRPANTKFMKLVTENGGNAYNGLKMLLYQGIIAYELWNQVKISEEIAEEIFELLKERVAV